MPASRREAALPGGTWTLGDREVTRFGYGAMQLAGPWVMGPPADHEGALAVLRRQVQDNVSALGVDALDLVNMRMGDADVPRAGSIAEAFTTLAELQRRGLVRHLGVSNVTAEQVAEARSIAPVVCVQNVNDLAVRHDDDLVDDLARDSIAYVPFFPLGGFTPLQSSALSTVADRSGTTSVAVALSWLLQRSPNVLLIAGTKSVEHLHENIAGAGTVLSEQDLAELDAIGR